MDKFTAILLYPGDTEDIETYVTTVEAADAEDAIDQANLEASDANDGLLKPEDFRLLALFAGDCDLLYDIRDEV